MLKRFQDTINSGLATAAEQAKARSHFAGSSSPRNSTSIERPSATVIASANDPTAADTQDEQDDADGDGTELSGARDQQLSDNINAAVTATELPVDVRKKLARLDKMEDKYPALLKAYRGLQGVEAQVKVFEKALAELTAASSIADVEAFQQWATNSTLKGDMAMEELRKQGIELSSLRSELASKDQRVQELESTAASAPIAETSKLEADLERLRNELDSVESDRAGAKARVQSLEKSVSELRDSQSEALNSQRKELAAKDAAQKRKIKELTDRVGELEADLSKRKDELIALKVKHAQELRGAAVSKDVATETNAVEQVTEPIDEGKPEPTEKLSKNQKKRQKKKAAGVTSVKTTETLSPEESAKSVQAPSAVTNGSSSSSHDTPANLSALQAEIDKLRIEAELHKEERDRLQTRLGKSLQDAESVEEMRDMVKEVGDELVNAKERIRTLTGQLEAANSAAASASTSSKRDNAETIRERDELKQKLEQAEAEKSRLAKDLEIAESLSAERFKELSKLKDQHRQYTSELSTLKTVNGALQGDKEGLESRLKSAEQLARTAERSDKDRRDEVNSLKTQLASREKELRVIQNAFKEEELKRKAEESRATTVRGEMSKMQDLRDTLTQARDDLTRQLSNVKAELERCESKLSSLQQQRATLLQERDAAREELELGRAKFDSAKSLMESQHEQTQDMQHRLREAEERRDVAEEELAESSRQLRERGREADTLRRLLTELEGSLETRVREMRERMEAAFADRDRAEDEAAAAGKRRMRELEGLQEKLVESERQHRRLDNAMQDSDRKASELQRQLEQIQREREERDGRHEELVGAVSDLTRSMKAAETQVTNLERERDKLRVGLQDAEQQVDRLRAELDGKNDLIGSLRQQQQQQHQQPAPITVSTPQHQQRQPSFSVGSPMSPRVRQQQEEIGSPTLGRTASLQSVALSVHEARSPLTQQQQHHQQQQAEVDRTYIRNILLQVLDNKAMRPKLAPVLGKLLLMDKQQESTFMRALK
ncbi:Golgin imh1 [Savitreella phatthalungensis]